MEYNTFGTLKMLIAAGAITGVQQKSTFDIFMSEGGIKSREAWAKYLQVIKDWLRDNVNDKTALAGERDKIAKKIHEYWFKVAPEWADEGKWGKIFTYQLNEKGNISDNDFIYIYCVNGSIKMQDHTVSYTHFQAHIWGNPKVMLRSIRFDRMKIKIFETQCIKNLKSQAKLCEKETFDKLSTKFDNLFQKMLQN